MRSSHIFPSRGNLSVNIGDQVKLQYVGIFFIMILLYIPGRCHIRIRRVQISRRLGPPRARAPAIVAASAGRGRCSHGATLAVQ